jgi:hypothetical protein
MSLQHQHKQQQNNKVAAVSKVFFWSHQHQVVNVSEVETERLNPRHAYICYNVSTTLHSLGALSAYK